ncbi:hypothetical protein [Rugosimonospora africana]|uniref:hypothetical protein n=1 Tax=Rugosimonospora africana TaxID=556532 RepID=UPI003571731F
MFIIALTRVIAIMGRPPTALSMVRGLVLLLLWMTWTTYAWLSNRAPNTISLSCAGVGGVPASIRPQSRRVIRLQKIAR